MRRLPIVAGLGALALAAGAALEGQSLATSHPDAAAPLLAAAALLGFLSVRLFERGVPTDVDDEWRLTRSPAPLAPERNLRDPGSAAAPTEAEGVQEVVATAGGVPVDLKGDGGLGSGRMARRRRVGGLALIGFGGAYSALAAVLLGVGVSAGSVTGPWLLGLGAVLGGAILVDGRRSRVRWRPSGFSILELGTLLAILGVAVWLRMPDLATIPPNVHGDEASIGLDARLIIAGDMPAVFATGWYDVPALSFAVHAATMRVFGDNLFGLRMASAIEGVLSILLLYLLARRLWGPRPALLAAAFMAIAAWHIHFSRTGFHYMQAPVATLLALYFLVRGLQDRRILDWVLCGFAIGLCVEVYYAARLAPVVVAVYLAYRTATERGFLATHSRGLLALLFAAIVFLAPMAVVYGRSEGSFIQRAAAVLVTSPSNLQHEFDAYHVNTLWQVLAIQAQHTLEAFNIRGETSLEYGHPGPLFDFWTDALLAMGAIAILLRPGSSRGILLASWVWLALILGSVLTTDALFSPHLVVAIPALVLVPALVLERAWRGVTSLAGGVGTYLFGLPVALLLGLALQGNVHDYFDIQVVQRQPASRFTLLSNYAGSINASYRLYVIGRDDWTLSYDTPRFLVPSPDAVDVRSAALALPLDRIPASKGVAFLVENSADDFSQRIDAIRRAYPGGQEAAIAERPGGPATFTSYLVDNSALTAADPVAARD